MKKLLLNEQGGVHWIISICGGVIFSIMAFCIFIDSWSIDQVDRVATDKVHQLNLDIYSMLSVEHTAYTTGFKIDDETAALSLFRKGLQSRFNLDSSLRPTSSDGALTGPVQILNFRVIDDTELPYTDGYGRQMQFPGIVADLLLPVKTPMYGISGNHHVLITTEIYR
ncbi:hypothetical protein ACTHPH_21790 [Paenibacillus pasadenensis]|uniref:hypothetical protein n=1 Tax=Paenibacillus pasadenensis TaxID=217090 RepID=UPI000414AA44|nr:hypothetical protein [Paenibacillus pasadenensis]